MPTLEINGCGVGRGAPVFIVAEVSGNHGGNLETAKEIIRAAKRVGANAVKLQTYTADTITLDLHGDDFLIPDASPWSEVKNLYSLYTAAHTPWEWHKELFELARSEGLVIFSSPFDESAVDFLEALDSPCYKIASPEITHIPLLIKVAKTGKPVILSTGVATFEDIDLALKTLKKAGAKDIFILKCNSAYPSPLADTNLAMIPEMREKFGVDCGFSDHSIGSVCAITAVALGAVIIEKHLTLDNGIKTVDSFFSEGEESFRMMVEAVRSAELAIGVPTYDLSISALPSFSGRRSLYVSADIRRGEVFSVENIKCVRPGFGLHPKYYSQIIGCSAKHDYKCGDRLSLDDFL